MIGNAIYCYRATLHTDTVNDSTIEGFHISSFLVELNAYDRCYDTNQFRLIQPEHRGGFCNCLEVSSLNVTLTSGQTRSLRLL